MRKQHFQNSPPYNAYRSTRPAIMEQWGVSRDMNKIVQNRNKLPIFDYRFQQACPIKQPKRLVGYDC
jgi:hypothetical protein